MVFYAVQYSIDIIESGFCVFTPLLSVGYVVELLLQTAFFVLSFRTLRFLSILSHSFLSIKSGMGAVIETAKRNELNVFGYLSYLMLVLPSWGKTPSDEQLDSIMPWSATLPETCHRTYHQIVENEAVVE